MKTRAEMLALRRQMLIAECNMQRADLALQIRPLAYTLSSMNIGMRILNRVRQNPGWIAAGAIGLMAIRPRRLSAFFRLGSTGLRAWRLVQPLLQGASLQQALPHQTEVAGFPRAAITGADPRSLRKERIAQLP